MKQSLGNQEPIVTRKALQGSKFLFTLTLTTISLLMAEKAASMEPAEENLDNLPPLTLTRGVGQILDVIPNTQQPLHQEAPRHNNTVDPYAIHNYMNRGEAGLTSTAAKEFISQYMSPDPLKNIFDRSRIPLEYHPLLTRTWHLIEDTLSETNQKYAKRALEKILDPALFLESRWFLQNLSLSFSVIDILMLKKTPLSERTEQSRDLSQRDLIGLYLIHSLVNSGTA